MSAARDTATAAMDAAYRDLWGAGANPPQVPMEVLLDAIPRAVLAQLAVERAGLEQVGWLTPGMAGGPNLGALVDGKFDDGDVPVYRVVGESQ